MLFRPESRYEMFKKITEDFCLYLLTRSPKLFRRHCRRVLVEKLVVKKLWVKKLRVKKLQVKFLVVTRWLGGLDTLPNRRGFLNLRLLEWMT